MLISMNKLLTMVKDLCINRFGTLHIVHLINIFDHNHNCHYAYVPYETLAAKEFEISQKDVTNIIKRN